MAAFSVSAPDSSAERALDAEVGPGELVLIGCGKMGGALLDGWLAAGLSAERCLVVDPKLDSALAARFDEIGVRRAVAPPADHPPAAMIVFAVKPQMLSAVLPGARAMVGPETLVVSIAAGTRIATFQEALGAQARVVRAMPNTPVSVGRGASALIASDAANADDRRRAEALMSAVGDAAWLETEEQMDAVTAVSGSGPAYVFHMIEALAAAGEAEGLSPDLAMRLARATVIGAGALAHASDESAAQLRVNVTSPGGTTAAGLGQLSAEADGLSPLMRRTVAAAAARSRELGG